MKHLILLTLLLTAAVSVSAKDTPCQVDLYHSQSQFNKAIQKPTDNDLNRIISQKNITLPEVMAKADRFQVVKQMPEEQTVVKEGYEETTEEINSQPSESPSVFGGMFELLTPAKLRNLAR